MKNYVRLVLYLILFLLPVAIVYADVAYPLYVEPGFSMRHFRTLASERGFPPAFYTLPKPEGAEEIIPICVISEYTANERPNLSWSCGFEDIGDSVRFELSAYYEHEGWIEGSAILLDAAYFELVPIGQAEGGDSPKGANPFHLSGNQSQTFVFDSTHGEQVITLITVTVYETGEDSDFLFHVSNSGVLSGSSQPGELSSFTILTENGNDNSYLEGTVYFIRPKFQQQTWVSELIRATNGQEFETPASGPIEAETGHNLLMIPSLISYFAGPDEDFEVKSFPNLSDNRAWFQIAAQNGSEESWAEWQNIVIQVPEDTAALSNEPFEYSPLIIDQPTDQPTAQPTAQTVDQTADQEMEEGENFFSRMPVLLTVGILVIGAIVLIVIVLRRQK
jgi:hypothetical protein